MEMNIASRDSSEKWKENMYIHKLPKACTAMKNLLGKAYTTYAKGLGFPENCPYPSV